MEKICPICNKKFTPLKAQSKYCSDECKKITIARKRAANREKNAEYSRQYKLKMKAMALEIAKKKGDEKTVKHLEAIKWLNQYNSSGQRGGEKMIADALNMSYSSYSSLPLDIKYRKRKEVLEEKRWLAK